MARKKRSGIARSAATPPQPHSDWPRFAGKWPRSAGFVPADEAATCVVSSHSRYDERAGEPRSTAGESGRGGFVKPAQHYTGGAVLGIATMHKSNAVPVFDREAAVELARMRR